MQMETRDRLGRYIAYLADDEKKIDETIDK